MKLRIEQVTVETYKTGPKQGEWRTFELPEGAIVLKTFTFSHSENDVMTITYAVPA